DGVAAAIAGGRAVDADPVAARSGAERDVGETARLAEDDEGGAPAVDAVGRRRHHDIADPIAVEIARGRDGKAAFDAARENDAEPLAGSEVSAVDGRRPGSRFGPGAENHVGGVVGRRVIAEGNPRCPNDDVGDPVAVDVAGGGHRRAGKFLPRRAVDLEAVQPIEGRKIDYKWNPDHGASSLLSNTRVTTTASNLEDDRGSGAATKKNWVRASVDFRREGAPGKGATLIDTSMTLQLATYGTRATASPPPAVGMIMRAGHITSIVMRRIHRSHYIRRG